jgi:alpha-L-fucosidase
MNNTNRREFLRKTVLGGTAAVITPSLLKAGQSNSQIISTNNELSVKPNLAQQAWMDLKFGMFIHFGINTYYDKEWSDGTLDISAFNPTELDTDQWCSVAKKAGMKYIVIITKHHDGFCLWNTKYTDYSVKNTPFKGDVIARLAESADKYGLKLGLYYSLWDRHEKSHDENEYEYIQFMKAQLQELLTGYGDVVELWFDGFWKKQKSGWAKQIKDDAGEKITGTPKSIQRDKDFIQAWRNEGAYRWQMDHLYQYIKSFQQDCLVMNNSTTAYPGVPLHPVDIRSGEKYTEVNENDVKVWDWLGEKVYLPMQIETTMSVKGNEKFPSGNWFWHEWDKSVASKEKILGYLDVAGKMNANLLLNCGVMDTGKLRPIDVEVLSSLQD